MGVSCRGSWNEVWNRVAGTPPFPSLSTFWDPSKSTRDLPWEASQTPSSC